MIVGLFAGARPALAAEQVLKRDPEWAVPVLWRYEFRNVLAGEMRRGRMHFGRALLLAHLAQDRLGAREYVADPGLVMELVRASRCTAYDCEFVAIAESLRIPLVTSDRQILREFPDVAVSPEAFVSH